MEPTNRIRCTIPDFNLQPNSLSKHNKSVKHLQKLERIERNIIIDEEDVDDQVVIPNDFFQEKDFGRRPQFIDHFRLADNMRKKYRNTQTRSYPEIAYARVKITPKNNLEIEQKNTNKLVKIISTRFGKLIQTYHFNYQTLVGCEYRKIEKMKKMKLVLYQALTVKE